MNLGEEVILTLLRQYGASEYLLLTVQMLSFEHCVCVCVRERGGLTAQRCEREREKGGDHSVASCEREGQRERGSQHSVMCVYVCERERVTAQHRVCVCV